ncbi:MAG: aminotransferase class I/II-fold pyridoxal phosphate-dependent enzyme [Deltaproteobacteria bacterium]|nr:aminotransferase class I/II-fold pyridoxal phosphate-dependent enzyme [Deltaproteobacteria bacterium]MBW2120304.1 aminotransferase class I/II-fold pyridoxal phosphate-dependent enzyme [Deltaproteobacteria bacterium]
MGKENYRFDTLAVHAGEAIDPVTGATITPLYQTAAFGYSTVDHWYRVATEKEAGFIYSRNRNPTQVVAEEKIAALEGAERALVFSSGMAAITTTLLSLLSSGDHVVSVKDSYGGTYLIFTTLLPRFGVGVDLVETTDPRAIEGAVGKRTKVVYLETPTNPTLKVIDLERISGFCQERKICLIVDNTLATPFNQQPLGFGATLVIHSATKYLAGHGDVVCGAVAGPSGLIEEIDRLRGITGPSLDPHGAWLLIRGMKTLALRLDRQNRNALEVARFLENHPKVVRVFYPGLESHPQHAVAKRQMKGFGGMLSFELTGDYASTKRFLDSLRIPHRAANLGSVESLVGPPSTTSHVECTAEERQAAGIPETLVRYAPGIEDADDLIADLDQSLEQIG